MDVEGLRKKRFLDVEDGTVAKYGNSAFRFFVVVEKTEPGVVGKIKEAVAAVRVRRAGSGSMVYPDPDGDQDERLEACLTAIASITETKFLGDKLVTKFLRAIGLQGNRGGPLTFPLPSQVEATCTASLFVLRALFTAHMVRSLKETDRSGLTRDDFIKGFQRSKVMEELAYRKSVFRIAGEVCICFRVPLRQGAGCAYV